ncbi:carbohydrate ABC transporter membrane protein 2 (CUT1 family) [Rhizobium sp. PP-F2F-G38]|uniref:Carbohydrate ABC transporter permease n=1 Tax=Ferranicluibacter rubi TaxID=2715133 RepID=A0AA43ZHW5_9HYPH|nr:carbohydrate ABC transporter permease [Ferranicluibacter rubi]PYE34239.1 carbohydrate ABC transporter membrane protein 2 (CUT1 family) [Rhizobium sp. PP-WC-1G-195]PYE96875.1 carbohydrate ABC transporter membrane protein 2 (CUT1 family) [Rhizobium sp. PP-F2F-G38]TCP86289.1 carbohydrate ABC transporter membrane protein 2 (CUT1 family) [Rhizobium sp. PP-CC-2G-626]TCQ06190.1 carbohydrate ABC transporter membrane protein 2 (CUT1 family) [Rhizobium sp. PP-F2F-G36]TCQ23442.1 carbohydrate ABC trans
MSAASRERLGDALSYLFMLVIFVFFAWPLLWLLSLALRTRKEVFLGVSRFIPKAPTLDNFAMILSSDKFLGYLWNALKLSSLSAIGCLVVALPAAYAFSRFKFRGKGGWMMAILSVQMISPLVIMVPLYRYMAAIGLTDSHFGVVMVYIALAVPTVTWILKGSIDGIPRSLDEAALIDGCNRWGVFVRVILPLSTPGIASAFIISVIAGWSQFLVPFLLITREALTPIGVGIFQYAGTQNDSSIQLLAAACLVSVVPAIIAFLSLQRLILGAMTAGAVKG